MLLLFLRFWDSAGDEMGTGKNHTTLDGHFLERVHAFLKSGVMHRVVIVLQ